MIRLNSLEVFFFSVILFDATLRYHYVTVVKFTNSGSYKVEQRRRCITLIKCDPLLREPPIFKQPPANLPSYMMGNVQKLKLLESFSFTCSSIFGLFLSMAKKLLPPQNAKHIPSNLILWHCNTLTLQYFDTAILWYCNTLILWYVNTLQLQLFARWTPDSSWEPVRGVSTSHEVTKGGL